MENPLKKYVDELDNTKTYVQPTITPKVAQYILKALDYLHIYSRKLDEPALIEQPLHEEAEGVVTDIILEAPEEESNG